MNIEDVKCNLQVNLPIFIKEDLPMFFPSVKESICKSESNYNSMISSILFDKDNQEEFSKIDLNNFVIMCILFEKDPKYKKSLNSFFEMFFHSSVSPIIMNDTPYLKLNNGYMLNSDDIELIKRVIQISHFIERKSEPEYNAANSAAAKMIALIQKNKEKKPKKKERINFQSILSGLAWRSNSINVLNIGELNIYQVYEGYYRLHDIDNYQNMNSAIYTGNVDIKKLNIKDLGWANIISPQQ